MGTHQITAKEEFIWKHGAYSGKDSKCQVLLYITEKR